MQTCDEVDRQLAHQLLSGRQADSAEPKLRQIRLREWMRFAGPSGDHQHDRISQQPPSREQQRLSRRQIEQLRIVHQHRHRRALGVPANQTQCRSAHHEPLVWTVRGCAQREGGRQRLSLGSWDAVQLSEGRAEELQQAAERDLAFGLGAAGTQDAQVRGECRRLGHESRLPDSRFPGDQEYPAGSHPRPRDQPFDRPPLGFPPDQHVWQYTTN